MNNLAAKKSFLLSKPYRHLKVYSKIYNFQITFYNLCIMKTFIKKKAGPALGFRTPDFYKGRKFAPKGLGGKFNPSQFRTQHKGGSS